MEDLSAGHMPRLAPWALGAHRCYLRCIYLNSSQDAQLGGAQIAHGTFPCAPGIQNWLGRVGRLSSQGMPVNQVGTEQSMFGNRRGAVWLDRVGGAVMEGGEVDSSEGKEGESVHLRKNLGTTPESCRSYPHPLPRFYWQISARLHSPII